MESHLSILRTHRDHEPGACRSADFHVCCIAGFQTGGAFDSSSVFSFGSAQPAWKSAIQQVRKPVWKPALQQRGSSEVEASDFLPEAHGEGGRKFLKAAIAASLSAAFLLFPLPRPSSSP